MILPIYSSAKYFVGRVTRREPRPLRGTPSRFLQSAIPIAILAVYCGGLVAQRSSNGTDSSSFNNLRQVYASVALAPDEEHYGDLEAEALYRMDSSSSPNEEGIAAQGPPKDTPDTRAQPKPVEDERAPQTKRILGFIPNFRAISTDEKLPPQSVKEKFVTATQDSFDYSSIGIPALLAAYSLGTNATPEFGHGGAGYARYLWHAAVDQTSENYMVEFVVPVLTREDTRYYTLGRGGFTKRAWYAASRVLITRSDAGSEVLNLSEIVGAGGSAGLSTLYYPARERSFGNTGKQWGLDLGIDALADVAKEFWPDINHRLSRSKKSAAVAPQ